MLRETLGSNPMRQKPGAVKGYGDFRVEREECAESNQDLKKPEDRPSSVLWVERTRQPPALCSGNGVTHHQDTDTRISHLQAVRESAVHPSKVTLHVGWLSWGGQQKEHHLQLQLLGGGNSSREGSQASGMWWPQLPLPSCPGHQRIPYLHDVNNGLNVLINRC